LAIGYRLSAIGYWLLALGCWLIEPGYVASWRVSFGIWMKVAGAAPGPRNESPRPG
jgi:hypothetical protein